MSLVIARARIEAVPEADALIREAADWLNGRGLTLWGPEELSYDDLVAVARAGGLVLARVNSEAVACMYLHNEDRLFWPECATGEAFYIHRLAVKRNFAGRGFARAMLDWADAETRAQRRKFVRLDCEPRPKLMALYRDAGFAPVDPGPVEVTGHWVIRQEKRV
ncbi:MAG: GNAT family N-acetyltransferase [Alphaproteobacteria bacterium]|nr:GNAT family N-acetyltransferase [Alphaproteobacteria bacterium]